MARLFSRGIAPELLVSQVKNTMPWLFDPGVEETALGRFPPAGILRAAAEQLESAGPGATLTLSHFEYFRLCLSCHYLSCATPVPTDVDNQIRHKLWPAQLPLETALEMARLVLESRGYEFTQVTGRYVNGATGTPFEKEPLSGHLGEWFTVASGAYCAMRQYQDAPEAKATQEEILAAIAAEVNRHSEVFGTLWRANDGIGSLKAAAAIAHNFGDLDRVMDMWELPVGERLRLEFYGLGTTPFDCERRLRYLGRLWTAGELYKCNIDGSALALENHRHFALRKPRALRKSPAILIPTGPFFDDWGFRVARLLVTHDGKPSEDSLEVIAALQAGREKMPKTFGYARALRGFAELHPELKLDAPKIPREQFEKRWNSEALRHLDEIPSRA